MAMQLYIILSLCPSFVVNNFLNLQHFKGSAACQIYGRAPVGDQVSRDNMANRNILDYVPFINREEQPISQYPFTWVEFNQNHICITYLQQKDTALNLTDEVIHYFGSKEELRSFYPSIIKGCIHQDGEPTFWWDEGEIEEEE
ncbi:uncharacterized protein LACBIDRAFT_322417 [Laccaria bicolor S238N-H82]|uniref:Predicted protein n=1 Tax=Laccaria bicolor (strain S238N-H82 / ATCC MYA-4686) TaxID=486041 RepID=B0CW79_LACBS|nr:uncharacterized protein LACBIDRAFT_322417 [Laccaria bicolor S238N-H82]EDR13459.1 predicted protein [Laccaria bicolor S238N-H82]|eukprot:XP_001875957.1 predicted protein [Laccaria bicolor S238N-H82]